MSDQLLTTKLFHTYTCMHMYICNTEKSDWTILSSQEIDDELNISVIKNSIQRYRTYSSE